MTVVVMDWSEKGELVVAWRDASGLSASVASAQQGGAAKRSPVAALPVA